MKWKEFIFLLAGSLWLPIELYCKKFLNIYKLIGENLKLIVHPKMKLLSSVEHKIKYFEKCLSVFCPYTMEVNGNQNCLVSNILQRISCYVPQKIESHTGLEHEGEDDGRIFFFSFFCCWINYSFKTLKHCKFVRAVSSVGSTLT